VSALFYQIVLVGAIAMFFIGIVVIVVTIATSGTRRSGVNRGLHTIDRVYSSAPAAVPEEGFSDRVVMPAANRVTRLGRQVTPRGGLDRLRRWLDYAGNPPYWTADRIFSFKGIGLLAFGVMGALIGLWVNGGVGAIVLGLVGAFAGYFAVDLFIYDLGDRRQDQIRRAMPDVLDTLTVSVEAGLGFDAALVQVVRYGKGPLVGEFARVLQEMQIGRSRVDALRSLPPRTKVIELRSFCSVVVQASDLGVPIANVLREQSKEMRLRRRQRAEELAQKIPVKILFPLILCLFPALFIVVIGPGALNILGVFDL
jgi:tight adherence protein C